MRKIGSNRGPQPPVKSSGTSQVQQQTTKSVQDQPKPPKEEKPLPEQTKSQRRTDKQYSGVMHRIAVEKHAKPLPPIPQGKTPRPSKPLPPTPGSVGQTSKPLPPIPQGKTPHPSKPLPPTPGFVGQTSKPLPPIPQGKIQHPSKPLPPTPGSVGQTSKPLPPIPQGKTQHTSKPLPPTPGGTTITNPGKTTTQSSQKAPPNTILDHGLGAKRDHKYDGAIVGKDSKGNTVAWSSKTDINKIGGTKPDNGKPVQGKCLYVNGMNTKLGSQMKTMQGIANQTGHEVIGIHNSTHGFIRDGGECIKDKMNIGNNGAHKTLTDSIYNHVKSKPNEPLNIVCHSQGGIITSRALRDVKNRLRLEDGMSKQQSKDTLQNVTVQTAAAAAVRYPSGPKYLHHVNTKDPVPQLFGGAILSPTDSGKHGEVHRFTSGSKIHSINDTYMQHLVPFQNIG